MPEAEQGMKRGPHRFIARGMPVEISAMTINRFCSSFAAIAIAADRIGREHAT